MKKLIIYRILALANKSESLSARPSATCYAQPSKTATAAFTDFQLVFFVM